MIIIAQLYENKILQDIKVGMGY